MSPWIYLAITLVAGGLPPRLFWGRGMLLMDGAQMRARYSMLNPGESRRRRRWWKSPAVWLDPARGWLAGWALCSAYIKGAESMEHGPYLLLEYGGYVGLLALVAWQTCGRERERETLSPLLFIGGVLTGVYGWLPGVSALALGLLSLVSTQSLPVALFAMAGTMAALGWFLIGFGPSWLIAIAVCLTPWAKSFLLRHKLVVAMRG
ncbi:MAG: hypothetical protein EAZ36_07660 [Verrucomicrobia bacterium]|nr:MAG: hypothetical protein EAZ36_07660 [Verrucomicrobiota bacterium]